MAQWGQQPPINENPLVAQVVSSSLVATPGERIFAKVRLTIDKDYKAYQDKFQVTIQEPSQFIVRGFEVKPTFKFFDPISKKNRMGFKGQGELVIDFEVSSTASIGRQVLPVQLSYQACTDKICLFTKTVALTFQVDVRSAAAATDSNKKSFWSQMTFESAHQMGTFFAFLFVFIAGLLTSFTPCVYPMIPITLAVLGAKSHHHSHLKGFLISFVYVTGIGVMFSGLGVLAATSGRLFGSLLGHPVVISFVSFVFFLMALSMFGVFQFQAPLWLQEKATHLHSKGPYIKAFLSGIVSGIIAAPCVGPVIVSILTHVAQTKDIVYGFFLLFFYSFGMGVLFLVLGTFSQFTRYLPRSGPWMNGIKYLFGIVMLFMSVYYVSPIVLKKYGLRPQDFPSLFSISPPQKERIKFLPYSPEAHKKALLERKPMIIDFYADWCASCVELEEKTYTYPEVVKFSEKFVNLQFDATLDSPELTKLKEMFDIKGLPTVVFIDSNGTWVKDLTLTGFEDGPQFLERMKLVR